MSEQSPLLKVDGLQAGYGDVQVLWGVDLTVQPGEIACVVGSNGAGKTTLLRTISGLLSPSAGSIRFAGREAEATRLLREIVVENAQGHWPAEVELVARDRRVSQAPPLPGVAKGS